MNGVIVVNKPEGWTSHDAVNKLRRLAGTRKVGHLGTLDPMATGVLPLVVGGATRLAQFYTSNDKVYDAVIHFGYSTDTYDRDGAPTSPVTEAAITPDQIGQMLAPFRGTIEQIPPPISAKKVGGVPAYKLARRHQAVELKAVVVTIYSIDLLECEGADVRLVVHCSAGTYLRALAHDLGKLAGCGAFLKTLIRTRSGNFCLEQSRTIDELATLAGEQRLREALVPAADLLPEFPSEVVDRVTAGFIRQGRDFRVSPFRVRPGARYVKAIDEGGELVAIGEARLPNLYHPILVL